MENYVYIDFKLLPAGYSLDEIEDGLVKLLKEQGEVTGAGIGKSGGNIDVEIFENINMIQNIKSYLLSCGFGKETVLDINGKREFLS